MRKQKHFRVKCFWNFSLDAEIHAVPKTWEKWISIIREKYGKTETFQIYGFLKYFGWSRNPYNSQNLGKVNFHNTGKVWEKNKHSKVMGFSRHTIKPGTPKKELRNTEHRRKTGKLAERRNASRTYNWILAEQSEYRGTVEHVKSSGTT